MNYNVNGIFCEHGHRFDAYNRDGAISGHSITNNVFAGKVGPVAVGGYLGAIIGRPFDPRKRPLYTGAASLNFMGNMNFDVYIMAHTHSPYLTKVYVSPSTVSLLDAIKSAANRRDVPYQSLIKIWLHEKLHEGHGH